jgi:hypothetical protein
MNRTRSLRTFNPSHAVLIAGLVLSLLAVMFRPAGAGASLPQSVDVFKEYDAKTPGTAKLKDQKTVDQPYKVIYKNGKKPQSVTLTGIPLPQLFTEGALDGVQFVTIQFGPKSNSRTSIQPLFPGEGQRQPMILEKGKKPGYGSFQSPSIIPGLADPSKSINETSFAPFLATGDRISITPGKPGAKLMDVRIVSKFSKKTGEYTLTATIQGGGEKGATREYQWSQVGADGKLIPKGVGPSIVTDDATKGTSQRYITVKVVETASGSTGAENFTYTAQKKEKGAEKNPYPDPTPTTGSGTGSGSGTGQNGVAGGTLSGGGAVTTPLPGASTTPTPAPSTTPAPAPATQPTAPTTAAAPSIDTTSITNAAQNVSGSGKLQTVSGVLLSSPTAAPAAAGGGANITQLPDTVATELNTIFKPVDGAEDVWAYLLAVLFAFLFSGAVREWVNP